MLLVVVVETVAAVVVAAAPVVTRYDLDFLAVVPDIQGSCADGDVKESAKEQEAVPVQQLSATWHTLVVPRGLSKSREYSLKIS